MTRFGDFPCARKRGAVTVAALTLVLFTTAPMHAACVGDCRANGTVTVDDLLTMVNIALGDANVSTCLAGDADNNKTITIDEILTAVNNALAGCAQPTHTPVVATATATPSVAPTYGVLGVRHFIINPATSPFKALLGSLSISLAKFEGQTNGQTAPAFLDLEAGQPDPVTGIATINITNASEFIYANATVASIVLCLKPLVPVTKAGVVACNGGQQLGFTITQDHTIGVVGVNGFTAHQCQGMNGNLQGPNQTCAAGGVGFACRTNADCDSTTGSGDGVCGIGQATCTAGMTGSSCQADADCDTAAGSGDGACGTPAQSPDLPGVCNGPFVNGIYPGDTGSGGVVLAPVPEFQLVGFPIRLSIQSSLPCVDPGPSGDITFALTSGVSQTTILDANNTAGQTLSLKVQGQNFPCATWRDPTAGGRLVLSAPQIDQAGFGDIITSFTFDSSPIAPTPTSVVSSAPSPTPTAM
ncbi:MAG: hypothetical protein ACHQ4J_02660 [Candidatus Binatia bacterium]